MAPSAVPINSLDNCEPPLDISRPAKKIKLDQSLHHPRQEDMEEPVAIPSHPLDVKPSGNAYTATENLKDNCGVFAMLPDELLMQLLEYLPGKELQLLGSTCKALHAFSRADELWKELFVQSPPVKWEWLGTWRSTYLSLPKEKASRISCSNLFSDALHRPFFCAHTPLTSFISNIPPQNNITRLSDLTEQSFQDSWTNTPFILTEPVKDWPVYHHLHDKWTTDYLLHKYHDVSFRAEAVDWPLHKYIDYMRNSTDESPLYLFDRSFAEKMHIEVGNSTNQDESSKRGAVYWPPTAFGHDLFSLLGKERPDSKWLIMGPARSGSTFHKDPNATSAWNAVLTGSKYWLMFPSAPPGIFLSADSAEITSPLSIAEYLHSFHALARKTPGCIEAVCHAGEVLYVPSGWFHLVLNIEDGIALTQNFVPRKKLPDVLGFLRDTPDQVSGFKDDVKDPYGLFVERLRESAPEVLEEAMAELERRGKKGRGRWEEIVRGGKEEEEEGENGGGFSFGFGGDDEDEEIP